MTFIIFKVTRRGANYYPTETRLRSDVAHNGTKVVADMNIYHNLSADGEKWSHMDE